MAIIFILKDLEFQLGAQENSQSEKVQGTLLKEVLATTRRGKPYNSIESQDS